jgi:hypothetical protein
MAEKNPLPDWVRSLGTLLGVVVLGLVLSWLISLLGNLQKEGKIPSPVGGKGDLVLPSKHAKSRVQMLEEEEPELPTWEVQIRPFDATTDDELVARLVLVDENGPGLPSEDEFFVRWTRGNEVVPSVKGWRVSPELTAACELWRVAVSVEGKRTVAMVTVLPAEVPEVVDPGPVVLSGAGLIPRLPAGVRVDTREGVAALRRFVRMDVHMGKRSTSILGRLFDTQPHLGALLEDADIAASALQATKAAETMTTAISIVEAYKKLQQIGSSTDDVYLEGLMPVRMTVGGAEMEVLSASAVVGPYSPDLQQAKRRLEKQEAKLMKPGSVSQRQLDAISGIAVYLMERERILGCVSGG